MGHAPLEEDELQLLAKDLKRASMLLRFAPWLTYVKGSCAVIWFEIPCYFRRSLVGHGVGRLFLTYPVSGSYFFVNLTRMSSNPVTYESF